MPSFRVETYDAFYQVRDGIKTGIGVFGLTHHIRILLPRLSLTAVQIVYEAARQNRLFPPIEVEY